MRQAKISHLTSCFDCANAFYSVDFARLDKAIQDVSFPADSNLLRRRVRRAVVQVHACDGALDLQKGSGTLQGDGLAAQLFLEPYHPILDAIQSKLQQLDTAGLLVAHDPIADIDVNVSLSSYADDVAGKLCGKTPQELANLSVSINQCIDTEFARIGLGQNHNKQEHVTFFAKAGARAHYRAIFCDNLLAGKVCRQARYLGPPYTFNGSHASEVDERLVAAKLGWVACGRFWSRLHSAHKGKLCVFRGMVYTPVLAGLETCVLDKAGRMRFAVWTQNYAEESMSQGRTR